MSKITDNQKYDTLLLEIGELLRRKNDEIIILEFQNKQLKEQLLKAEKEAQKNGE